jgi:uncharacterized protein (TIGR00299 family) protein
MPNIHLDPVGGIAGDMFVAALLDAFPRLQQRVLADARAVLPVGYSARLVESGNGPLRGLSFGLSGLDHDRHHEHGHHHDRGTADAGSFLGMVGRIRSADLSDGTADQAIGILTLIAEVEAAIHQVTIDAVHFHEIADWDSLLDVVAAGSITAALSGARWTVSPLPRGGGMVNTRHGLLPVPAPATVSLLIGFTWRADGVDGERVTPTGAAILRHLIGPDGSADALSGRLISVGVGAGTRTLPGIPNVLRALVFDDVPAPALQEQVTIVSFEIDDMTGEEIATAADRLRAVDGLLDLTIRQVHGKKGRSMQSFQLLVRTDRTSAVVERCFLETSTIGLRIREEQRVCLRRRLAQIESDSIPIGVKTVERAGTRSTKAENDDLLANTLEERRRLKRRAEEGGAR